MSERRVDTTEGKIRRVTVRWDQVLEAGRVVEMTLSYRIAEAEQVYGKRWDRELDRHIQMGMFARDRIAGTDMGKVAAAEPRVVDGVCRRTVRIGKGEDAGGEDDLLEIDEDGLVHFPDTWTEVAKETWVRNAQERQRNRVAGPGVKTMRRIVGIYRPPKEEGE